MTKIYQEEQKLDFGKYVGIPFNEVMEKDVFYSDWCLKNLEKSAFTEYLKQNKFSLPDPTEKEKLNFGKHKGKTFGKVLDDDPNYCKWAAENLDSKEYAKRFIQWLEEIA